jgi:hypothetical protein
LKPAYILSLPERGLRSLAAVSGGLLRETANVALPASLRRTTLYHTMVDVALRFLIEEVGRVEGIYPSEGTLAANFLIQRGASHGVEILGILAFHASPVWVLAALADTAGGGRALVREISSALKEEGLLEPGATFETVDQVLDGLERTSGTLANALNLPPVDVPTLRGEWERLKSDIAAIPPKKMPTLEAIEGVWTRLRESAAQQGRSVFAVSSMVAVSTVRHLPERAVWLSRAARSAARRTGRVFGETILDHYSATLHEMSRNGVGEYWRREFRPYLRAAAEHFAPERQSYTEKLLDRRDG